MYTIGQVAQMFALPVSTLRYYDKEGLFPALERKGGVRQFGDGDLEALRVIECLKKSGLEIRDIKQFMDWCRQGPATYGDRLALFERQQATVEAEIAKLEQTLAMIRFKRWYYTTALRDGGEQHLQPVRPDRMPPEVRAAWALAHRE